MKKITRKKVFLLSFGSLILCSGCASIVSDHRYPVSVNSSPEGARFIVTNKDGVVVAKGTTPAQVFLKAGAGYFRGETYTVSYKKRGYEPQSATLCSEFDEWYIGNIVFGGLGLIGALLVDPLTGAMWELPESVNIDLCSEETEDSGFETEEPDTTNRQKSQTRRPRKQKTDDRDESAFPRADFRELGISFCGKAEKDA